MSNIIGNIYRVCIFGESHSAAIGIVIDGIPAGMPIDMDRVDAAMRRRAPNSGIASTSRKEPDAPEVLSGFVNGKATGTPLCAIIRNRDMRSGDYIQMASKMRPGHADYTGFIKYHGANDIRGGGHFSGRLTAPLVFAGAIAEQYLNNNGIYIGAHIIRLGGIADKYFEEYTPAIFKKALDSYMSVLTKEICAEMENLINNTSRESDSLGGVIECAACGLPVGLGEPFFDSVESRLSHILFSIPAVKGVEFGAGFSIADMKGSKSNDSLSIKDNKVVFDTNNNGGINGGITNGMPVVFKVAVKPTPSIAKQQATVDIQTMEDVPIEVKGRHDVCIVPRVVEVVRATTAITFMDLHLQRKSQ